MMNDVVIYTTPTCPYCKMAKRFFDEHDVKYQERDVARDLEARQEMVQISGQLGVPVMKIGDKIVIGFDKEAITELLGISPAKNPSNGQSTN